MSYADPHTKLERLLKEYRKETSASDAEIAKIIGAGAGNFSKYLNGKKQWPGPKRIEKYNGLLEKALEEVREKKNAERSRRSKTMSNKVEDPNRKYRVKLIEQDKKIEEQGKEIGKLQERMTYLEEEVKTIRIQLPGSR